MFPVVLINQVFVLMCTVGTTLKQNFKSLYYNSNSSVDGLHLKVNDWTAYGSVDVNTIWWLI